MLTLMDDLTLMNFQVSLCKSYAYYMLANGIKLGLHCIKVNYHSRFLQFTLLEVPILVTRSCNMPCNMLRSCINRILASNIIMFVENLKGFSKAP